MRTRMYGGVGGRKTKVGRKLTFVFLLPDYQRVILLFGDFEHEVFWKPVKISPDGLFQYFSFHLIQFRQIKVQHYAYSAYFVNLVLNDIRFHIRKIG